MSVLFVKKTISDDAVTVGVEAIQTLRNCSKEREDGNHQLLSGRDSIVVHRNCRKDYTRPSKAGKKKKRNDEASNSLLSPTKKKLRSESAFDFKITCFFVRIK